jgi:hypothetical protein
METWIALSLNNSRAELSISKQKDRKTEREGERERGGKRGRGKERGRGGELEIAWRMVEKETRGQERA